MRQGKQFSFRSEEQFEALKSLSEELGFSHVSRFLQAIADQQMVVTPSYELGANLPESSSIYFCYAADGELLYIGETANLRKRWTKMEHHKEWDLKSNSFRYLGWVSCPEEIRLDTEIVLIAILNPRLNIRSSIFKEAERFKLRLLARLFGQPSFASALVRVLDGRLLFEKSSMSLTEESLPTFYQNLETFQKYEFYHHAFEIVYKNDDNSYQRIECRYGEHLIKDGYAYFHVWTEDEDEESDLPELKHNRRLKIDQVISIEDSGGNWRDEGLDFAEVEFEIYEPLIGEYEKSEHDISASFTKSDDGAPKLIVKRKVYDLGWLIEDLLRYSGSFSVLQPESVRTAIRKMAIEILESHQE